MMLRHKRAERLIEANNLRLQTLQMDLIAEILGVGLSDENISRVADKRKNIAQLYSDGFSQIMFGSVPVSEKSGTPQASIEAKAALIKTLGRPEGFSDLADILKRINEARESLTGK